jgi:hypothetical protein
MNAAGSNTAAISGLGNAARRHWFRFERVESFYSEHGPGQPLGHVVMEVVFPSTVA